MPKKPLGKNVLEVAKERISWTFQEFPKLYISFSAGKDSTVLLHLVCDEARRIGRRVGVLLIDLEGQYAMTIAHAQSIMDEYNDVIDPYWICLPLSLRNAVSVYEPKWICWDKDEQENWIREQPKNSITDEQFFPFFYKGMEFEEFIVFFGEWFARGESCACFVGIRTDESLNRFRTIASQSKTTWKGKAFTTKVIDSVFNIYPIYDWRTRDIWIYHGKYKNKSYNKLYDMMHQAGLSIHLQRICQPYGDDQRRGLWLFHLIEPQTWAKVVARVNGANSGALYIHENGNINGYNKITKPENHTWKSFALMLLNSMPPKTKTHFENKIILFLRWWRERGYLPDIPDESPLNLEMKCDVPSWRRICKSLLRNDYWCKGLGFSQHKNHAYLGYLDLMKRRRLKWGINDNSIN